MQPENLIPRGPWLVIKRVDETPTALALPEGVRERMQSKTMCQVKAKGPKCSEDYEIGAIVIVNPTGVIGIDAKNGWLLAHDEAVLAVVKKD